MPRAGLSAELVVETAARILDEDGQATLTLARVADELGVRAPSLYSHVDGLAGLTRAVAIRGIIELGDSFRAAAMGRSGEEGLIAIAQAYRSWAVDHPGVYLLAQVARPDDEEHGVAAQRLLEPLFAILRSYGLAESELVHAARTVRGTLHGFVQLETNHGFGMDVSVDESFAWMLEALSHALSRQAAEHPSSK